MLVLPLRIPPGAVPGAPGAAARPALAKPPIARTAAASADAPSSCECPKNSVVRKSILDALNVFIVEGRIHLDPAAPLGKTRDEILQAIGDPYLHAEAERFSEDVGLWTETQSRMTHRLLLENSLSGAVPLRATTAKRRRTLRYRGRGEIVGEIALLRNTLRTATCVAFDHPEYDPKRLLGLKLGAVPSRIEIVRIEKDLFQELANDSPNFKAEIEKIAGTREADDSSTRRSKPGPTASHVPAADDPDFEELGLQQGQKLMLIDLDRCTRCGSCVDACVNAHTDGRTRLYLDGPRFGNFLVPLTCRQCYDPLCLIGCPVGSIVRGNNGEIQIENWCIGCSMCADQCPYGSIQMELIAPWNPEPAKMVEKRAVVCDLCSSLPKRDPACVYACPHDAAFRINAGDFYFADEPLIGNRQ